MSILTKIREKYASIIPGSNKACYFCKRKSADLTNYRNEHNNKIKVCPFCVEYAERRAFHK